MSGMTTASDAGQRTGELIRGWAAALAVADVAWMHEHLAEDATWTVQGRFPGAATYRGSADITDVLLPRLFAMVQPGSVTIAVGNVVAEGDAGAAEWVLRAQTSDGREYVNSYHVAFTVSAGRITAIREYFDTATAIAVLFAEPPGAASA